MKNFLKRWPINCLTKAFVKMNVMGKKASSTCRVTLLHANELSLALDQKMPQITPCCSVALLTELILFPKESLFFVNQPHCCNHDYSKEQVSLSQTQTNKQDSQHILKRCIFHHVWWNFAILKQKSNMICVSWQ